MKWCYGLGLSQKPSFTGSRNVVVHAIPNIRKSLIFWYITLYKLVQTQLVGGSCSIGWNTVFHKKSLLNFRTSMNAVFAYGRKMRTLSKFILARLPQQKLSLNNVASINTIALISFGFHSKKFYCLCHGNSDQERSTHTPHEFYRCFHRMKDQ